MLSSPLASDLAAFRATHERRTVDRGGVAWRYVRSRSDHGPTLLMLGGALGEAEFGFRAIALLERDFTVIAPDYPPVRRLDEMVAGLGAVLAAEGAAQAHVIGGSFGGIVAQAFAARRPDAVASLTLSHTGPPHRNRAAGLAAAALGLFPERWLRALFRSRVRGAVEPAGAEWLALFEGSVARLDKHALLSRVRLAAEFSADRGYGSGPSHVPVMILSGSDDPLIGSKAGQELQSLYPSAQVHQFAGTGHLAAVLEPEAFAARIRDFVMLHGDSASDGGRR